MCVLQRPQAIALAIFALASFMHLSALAQEEEPSADAVGTSEAPAVVSEGDEAEPALDGESRIAALAEQQSQLHQRFERFRGMLLERADFERAENPDLAKLLERVVEMGNERLISMQLEQLPELVTEQHYSRAIGNQEQVLVDMQELLELLLTENIENSNLSQQKRIKEYLQLLEQIQRRQRELESLIPGTRDFERTAQLQREAADRARELYQQIGENEGRTASEDASAGDPSGEGSEGEGSEGEGSEGEGSEGEGSEGEGSEGEGSEGEGSEGEGSEGEGSEGEGSEGEGSEGEGSEGEGSEGQGSQGQGSQEQGSQGEGGEGGGEQEEQQQQDFPGRQRIMEAEQRMRDAQQKLEEANRRGAEEDAAEASRLLREAQAELEEILRQLREEHIERMLAMLESRFRNMLEMQLRVYEGTIRLAHVPLDRRSRETDVQAGRLSYEEGKIGTEAESVLSLLREEGSSTAFPEAVEQLLEDINQVTERLGQTRIDGITQGVEEDIIAALEETIAALQQAQKDLEESQQQEGQSGESGEPGEQPLVDQIAELKMIRSLHERVLKRTERYSMMLDDEDDPVGQAEDDELRRAIQKLGERQDNIRETIRAILLGRNE